MPGKVMLEAASDFAVGASFVLAAFDVGTCSGIVGHTGEDCDVKGTVEPPVSAAVETVTGGIAGRSRDRADTGQGSERGL